MSVPSGGPAASPHPSWVPQHPPGPCLLRHVWQLWGNSCQAGVLSSEAAWTGRWAQGPGVLGKLLRCWRGRRGRGPGALTGCLSCAWCDWLCGSLQAVISLMEMGFDEKEVMDALRVNNNQQNAAVSTGPAPAVVPLAISCALRSAPRSVRHAWSLRQLFT